MSTQRYSVTPHPIETLLTWVKSREIAIPEIQRPFVWEATKVRNLLDLTCPRKLIHPPCESRSAPVGPREASRVSMKRTRHTPEQVINKLREADAMLSSGRSMAQVLQHLGVSEQTFHR